MSQASIPTPPAKAIESKSAAATKPILTLTDMVASAAVNLKRVEFAKTILGVGIVVSLSTLLLVLVDHWVWPLPATFRWLCLAGLVSASLFWMIRRLIPMFGKKINPVFAAREIERKVPELKDSLVSYMQLSESQSGPPKGIVNAVGKFAVDRLSRHDIGEFIASTTPMKLAMWLFAILVLSSVYFVVSPKSGLDSLLRLLMPWQNIEVPSRVKIVKLTPKSAVVARGQTLEIELELRGWVPGDEVVIEFSTLDGQFIDQVIPMEPQIEGLTYRGTLTMGERGIEQPLDYRVRAGDTLTNAFRVDVEVVPLVAVEKLELHFPKYTKLEPITVEDPSEFEAIDGTMVKIFAQANQAMESGRIEVHPEASLDDPLNIKRLISLSTNDQWLRGAFQVQLNKKKDNPSPGSYRVTAVSKLGQPNADPVIYSYQVIADEAPVIQWTHAYTDQVDLPINHVADFAIKAFDPDFRIAHVRTSLLRGRSKLDETTLLHNEEGVEVPVDRTWRFEPVKMGLRPGDELTLQAFASDNRRDLQDTRWEPNISSTSIINIRIQPESNQPTEHSTPKDQAAELPDQPVDGSDLAAEQPKDANSNGEGKAGEDAKEPDSTAEQSTDSNDPNASTKAEDPNQASANESTSTNEPNGENKEQSKDATQADSSNQRPGDTSSGDSQQGEPQQGESPSNDNSEPKSDTGSKPGENASQGNPPEGSDNSASKPSEGQGASESSAKDQSGTKPGSQGKNGASPENQKQPPQNGNSAGQQGDSKNQAGQKQQPGQKQPQGAAGGEQSSEQSDAPSEASNEAGEPGGGAQPTSPGQSNSSNSSNSTNAGESTGSSQSASKPSGESSSSSSAQQGTATKDPSTNPSSKSTGDKTAQGEGQTSAENASSEQSPNSNGEKGRLEDVSQAGKNPDAPVDDGTAFEEIKKWMDKNGPPKDNSSSQGKNNPASDSPQTPNANPTKEPTSSQASGQDPKNASESGSSGSQPNPSDSQKPNGEPGAGSEGSSASKPDASPQDATANESASKPGANGSAAGKEGSSSESSSETNGASQPKPGSESPAGKAGQGSEAGSSEGASEPQSNNAAKPGEGKAQGGGAEASNEPAKPQPSQNPSGGNSTQGNESASGGSGPDAKGVQGQMHGESEANLDYAKQTTDMALEYLDRQRDQPDPELLKRLGWTADDLRNFVDRWKAAKEKSVAPNGLREDYMQDLRALGLTPSSNNKRTNERNSDNIRGLNEEGGRTKPPKSLQSQYEAFRKAAQQRSTKP